VYSLDGVGRMQENFSYKAFLSYSHKDQKEAAWLHSALEKYRLPIHLISETKTLVEKNGALGRVFRDRDELPVAEDLTAQVKKALSSSEFMIVLCSPRAAASRWVNKEVIEFKKLRGEAFVLPIIIDGVPGSDPATSQSECFPPGLRFKVGADGRLSKVAAEPIAADIRKNADGRNRAFLKLIAGLLGLGLDRLVERELQRKQRRVMAVTATSVVAMLFMGALTYQAIVARQEAEFQRGQAENLVEFMLTDLRERLEPVGRLDVLDSVAEKAVDYYRADDLSALPDDSVGRRARAFHMLGEIEKERHEPEKARLLLEQAMEATGDLLARAPGNAQRIYEHAQSVFWIGYLDLDQGDFQATEKAFIEYMRLSQKLVAIDPSNSTWQMELAYGYGNLGALQIKSLGQPEKAYGNFLKQADILAAMERADPGNVQLLNNIQDNHAWLADSKVQFGTQSEVLAEREKQRVILREIAALDPLNKSAVWSLMHSNRASGQFHLAAREFDFALEFYGNALLLAQDLVQTDSENKKWALNMAQVQLNLVQTHLAAGSVKAAKAILRENNSFLTSLLAEDQLKTEMLFNERFNLDLAELGIALATGTKHQLLAKCDKIEARILAARGGFLSQTALAKALAKLYILKARSLLLLEESAEAQLLLLRLWQGKTEAGALNKTQNQHPIDLIRLALIADFLAEQSEYDILREWLENRGFQAPSW
jgi:hypothetical protein